MSKVEIQFEINTDKATSSMKGLNSEYRKLLADLGKSGTEIKQFMKLAADAERGAVEVDKLDEETRQLLETHQALARVAKARQTLNLIPHAEITAEIQKVKAAYASLKQSGTLTQAELAQAALKTQQELARLESSAGGVGEAFANAKGELAAVAAAGAGLVAAARQAVDFESSMANVRKVTDLTDQQFEALTDNIKRMATELPLGANELAGIAAQAGQLGVASDDIEEFTLLAAKMATAFDISAEQAGESVAKLKNVFQLPLEDVSRLGDAINVLGNNTAAREKDIVEVLTRIGGSAKQFGLVAEEAGALAAALISLGKPPEVAATAINALLSKLQTANVGTKEFKGALGELGLSAEQLANDIRANPQQALTQFLQTLERLDGKARAEIITRMFGAEYQDDISLLIGSLNEYEKTLGLVADRQANAGAMSAEFAERMKTTQAQLDRMQNAVQVLAVNLGTVFLPAISKAAEGVGDIAGAVAGFVDEFPKISGLAAVVASVAASMGGLKLALAALRVVGVGAFADMAKQAALYNLTVKDAITNTGKLRTATSLMTAGLLGWEIGTWARENFPEVERLGIAMAGGVTRAFEYMRYAWESFEAVFTSDTVDAATERHKQRLAEIDDAYADMFRASLDAENGIVKGAQNIEKAAGQTTGAIQKVADAASNVPAQVAPAMSEIEKQFRAMREQGSTAADALKGIFEGLDLATPKGLTDAVDAMAAVGKEATTAQAQVQAMAGALDDISGAQLIGLRNELQGAFNAGRISADQLATALQAINGRSVEAVGLSIRELNTGISDTEQNALDMFNVFLTSGQASSEGVRRYIEQLQGTIANPAAVESLKSLVKGWEDTAGGSIKSVDNAVKTLAESVKGTTESLSAQITQQLQTTTTQAGIDALRESVRKMGADGLISAEQVQKGLQEIANESVKVSGTVNTEQDKQKEKQVTILHGQQEITAEMGNTAAAAGGIGMALAAMVETTRASLGALSEAALAAFNTGFFGQPVTDELDQVNQQLDQVANKIRAVQERMATSVDATGVMGWVTQMQTAAYNVEQAFFKQRQAFLALKEDVEAGSVGLGRLSSLADNAADKFDLLNDQDLSQLQSAIDAARQKIESLNASAQSTLNSIRNELDQLNGDTESVEQRNYEQRKAELQRLLEEAKRTGADQAVIDLQAALRDLEKLHNQKLDNIRDERRQEEENRKSDAQKNQRSTQEKQQTTQDNASRQTTKKTDQNTTQGNMTTIKLEGPGGQSATVMTDPKNANQLLEVLQAAGMRTKR